MILGSLCGSTTETPLATGLHFPWKLPVPQASPAGKLVPLWNCVFRRVGIVRISKAGPSLAFQVLGTLASTEPLPSHSSCCGLLDCAYEDGWTLLACHALLPQHGLFFFIAASSPWLMASFLPLLLPSLLLSLSLPPLSSFLLLFLSLPSLCTSAPC